MKLWIKRVSIVIVTCKISSLITAPQSSSVRPTPPPRSAVSLGSKSAEPTYASISPQSFQPPVPKQRFSIEGDRSKTHSNVMLRSSKATQKEVVYAAPKDLQFGSKVKPTPPPVPDRSKKPGLQDGPKVDRSTKPQPTPPPVIRSNKPSYLLKTEATSNNFDNEPRMMSRAEIQKALAKGKKPNSSSPTKTFE